MAKPRNIQLRWSWPSGRRRNAMSRRYSMPARRAEMASQPPTSLGPTPWKWSTGPMVVGRWSWLLAACGLARGAHLSDGVLTRLAHLVGVVACKAHHRLAARSLV